MSQNNVVTAAGSQPSGAAVDPASEADRRFTPLRSEIVTRQHASTREAFSPLVPARRRDS